MSQNPDPKTFDRYSDLRKFMDTASDKEEVLTELLQLENIPRMHQTLVLIKGGPHNTNFEERVIRLITSFNNDDTIKADVYTLISKDWVAPGFVKTKVKFRHDMDAINEVGNKWVQYLLVQEGKGSMNDGW